MSVTKPSKYPEWADGGLAVVIEPSDPKKALGWVVEKPAYQYFNWLFNLIYGWVQWFDQGYRTIQHVTASGSTNLALKSLHVMADATAGNQTLMLPDASADDGIEVAVTMIATSSSHTVTLSAQSGKYIHDGEGSPPQTQVINNVGTTLVVVSYGGNWFMK